MNASNPSHPITPSPRRPAPGAKYYRWPLIVIALLVSHVALMAWAATIAVKRGTGTVIPNYYQRSLKWDEEKAARLTASTPPPIRPATTQP